MSSHDPRSRIIAIGVIVAPMLLVQLTGTWLGAAGPREATAHVEGEPEDSDVPMSAVPARRPPKPEQERVASYLKVLRTKPFGPSPFYSHVQQVDAPPEQPIIAPEAPTDRLTLDVTVGAIMTMRQGAIALINGKPHRVGDAVAGLAGDGWRIIAINSDEGSVTFEHASGEVEVRSVR